MSAARRASTVFQLAVVAPVAAWLGHRVAQDPSSVLDPVVLFWTMSVVAVDLIPVPAWGGLRLSLSFPILLGVAIIYDPHVAGLVALLGSVDPRELKRTVTPLKAIFNRCQMGASILAASALFHAMAAVDSPWYRLVPAVLAAAVAGYGVNALLVAALTSVDRRIGIGKVITKMHGAAPYEFLLSYLGLGLFGAVIARFFIIEGVWSVVVFLAPLVFARQMYFRSRGLADRLAEQNAVLAQQAQHLERLLEKEQETVVELRELNRMRGEFVAVVSHELRTPLTALIGYAKTLRQPGFADDPDMREEFLQRMERQGDRLLRLVENLLTASNLENNRLPVSVGRVLLDDLCREIVEGLGEQGGRVELILPPDLPVLFTDRQLLTRVLSNLIDNALKYSPNDAACELGCRRDESALMIWVKDQGIGIAPDELRRIFDRFYQVDSSTTRTFRGAGLGLSLVKDLLHHLGGSIDVASQPDRGSTFTVTLPIRHPGVASSEEPERVAG